MNQYNQTPVFSKPWYHAKGASSGNGLRMLHLIKNEKSLCGLPREQPKKWLPWKTRNPKRICHICLRLEKNEMPAP
jgi:hypothetical protein